MKSDDEDRWFHGSDRVLETLREGSTVTQWRELAEAFSHKPHGLCITDEGTIVHNGVAYGYLYEIIERLVVGQDLYDHPRTTMGKEIEFLTTRPLQVKLLDHTGRISEEKLKEAAGAFEERSNDDKSGDDEDSNAAIGC